MAKLPALVTAIAEVDGRDRQSVEYVARTIRERGYITTGKRGGGAADIVAHEAANLLLALNGADTPKEGPTAIDRFRSLRQWHAGNARHFKAKLDAYDKLPQPLQDVMDVHTFGEALDALIEGVPHLAASFHEYACVAYERDAAHVDEHLRGMLRLGIFGLDVALERYAASVEMFTMHGSDRRVEFEANFMQDEDRMESGFYGTVWPDRKVRVTIGFITLLTAWQALNPDEALPGFPARSAASVDEDAE